MILNLIGAAANLCKYMATLPSELKFIDINLRLSPIWENIRRMKIE